MKYEVAGDPVSGLRWTRKTTKKIAAELSALSIRVSRKTVAKLLKQMNFSLRTNKKKISNGSPPTRDAQFANITQLRERFSRRGNPILSVDTKKKELVGRFKNPGRVWAQKSDAVNDHDFRSMADGVAIPYGIYDLQSNRGTVYVGTSYDTSQFAVECIEKWWRSEGQKRFPGRKHLLVVAETLAEATAQPAVHGNTASSTSCATSTVWTSRSHTIHQVRPSGTQSSAACSARLARIGRAGRSIATKPS